MRQTFERSSTEGAQLRILSEETRTANANIAPGITRLHARESQLPIGVSGMRNHETEFQGQLQHVQQENTRISVLVIHIQIAISSMTLGIKNWRSNSRRQTSNSIVYRLEFLFCERQ